MSIKAFPLNQTEYSYNAQDVMKYYAGRNSGVFETGDNLKVSANGGLELRINTGMGWLAKNYVASVAFWNESVEYLMVEAGHDTYDRIDLVVVSWNFIQQEQNPTLTIRKGTPASSPAVPSLINDSSTIEIALARINVAKGAITLSNSNIVDLRGNDTYCPMVYDEQTIRNAFVNCVGYADGVKKISDFPSVTPTANDKILVEKGGTGKSASIKDVVNTCSLTLEEIQASTNLTGKVASASALKQTYQKTVYKNTVSGTFNSTTKTITFNFSSLKNFHGMFVFTFKFSNSANFVIAFLSAWSAVELGRISQNEAGSATISGHIETGDFSIAFNSNKYPSSLTGECYVTGLSIV